MGKAQRAPDPSCSRRAYERDAALQTSHRTRPTIVFSHSVANREAEKVPSSHLKKDGLKGLSWD